MTKENNKVNINKHEIDIDTLKKQNVNDLLSIKELYRKLKEVEEKITQVKYIDSTLAYKLKKEYEKLKKIILDENVQAKLADDIETINSQLNKINSQLTNDIETINSQQVKLTNDIKTINSQLDTIANKGTTVEVLERVTKEEIDRQLADGTIANLTIANDSITTEKYKNNSISCEKTQFIHKYKNLYNAKEQTKESITDKAFLNNGNITANDSYFILAPIKVESNKQYTINFKLFGTLTNASICINAFSETGTFRKGFAESTFTTPSNTAYIRITVVKSLYDLDYINKNFMLVEGNTVPETYEKYGYYLDEKIELKINPTISEPIVPIETNKEKMYLYRSNENEFQVFISKYDKDNDLMLMLRKKSGNNLFDFFNWFKVPNNTDNVSTESVPSTRVQIMGALTDWIAPHILFATNNADGDFPTKDTPKFTGGWHMYNQMTAGNYTPTARTISLKGYANGVKINAKEGKHCSNAKIVWINRIQASNTEKQDGTGREVVEEKITVLFNSTGRCIVKGEITALEDVEYKTYYGLQMYNQIDGSIYYVGSRANRGANPKNSNNRSNDKYCNGVILKGLNDTFEMGINSNIDIGTQYANDKTFSALTTTSAKTYMNLVNKESNTNLFVLKEGEKMYWEGYYDIYPTVSDTQ